ncbi:MAG: transcriptional regulator GcvA [Proteobacteria bacterium]|nr:transcriptional regulator GcvA [Pseudomonadota bacterium]MBI3496196.1 transcriptional regulator GcvA [Pseudomonadota bacterium]
MSRRLPPLNALRAFEAAARHLSFVKAANELHVTPAAIGHQVRQLEAILGTPLFRRVNRTLLLTDAGQACLPGIRDGFQRLSEAIESIDAVGRAGVLTVSVAPSFAAKWLVPRLDRFQDEHPDLDVRVSASMQLVDFARDDVDVAIRYGAGQYPDLVVERLLPETVLPVCAPELLQGQQPLRSPADIRFHTLLHDDSSEDDATCPDWRMWLKAAKVEGVDWARGPRFNQSSLVLEAATRGRGVALAKAQLAADDLASGRLIRPFEAGSVILGFAYFIVYPPSKTSQQKITLFRNWLHSEAQRSAELKAA